jgi:trehalose synthase
LLVSSIDEAAESIVRLLGDAEMRQRLGEAARETVRKHFLLTRYLEQYLDLFNSFVPDFRLEKPIGGSIYRPVGPT